MPLAVPIIVVVAIMNIHFTLLLVITNYKKLRGIEVYMAGVHIKIALHLIFSTKS